VEKLLTQEEVDKIVADRLAREKKKLPPKEELDKFNEWKEAQKSEQERQAEALKELEQYRAREEAVIKENTALKNGVKSDDIDYVLFKVSKMEGDFEANLKDFLSTNPRFIDKEEPKTTGVKTSGVNTPKEDGVVSILKQRHPELF
jgi:murein L,D-transpeptidase YcbB/YkuD